MPMDLLSRHPRIVVVCILLLWGAAAWYAKDYIKNVVQPRQLAERLALVSAQLADAKDLFDRGDYTAAQQELSFIASAYGDDLPADQHADVFDWIGRSHAALGDRGGGEIAWGDAIEAFDRALALRPAHGDLAAHLATALRKGEALLSLAVLKKDPDDLARSQTYFDEMLQNLGARASPAAIAAMHRLAANSHRERYRLDPESYPMKAALERYESALAAAKPQDQPDAHAGALTDLARAYILLSKRKYRRRYLETAVEHLETARDLRGIDRVPRQHAETQLLIGDTYSLLAAIKVKRRSDRAAHQQRVIQYENRAKKAYRIAQGFGLKSTVGGPLEEEVRIVDKKKQAD